MTLVVFNAKTALRRVEAEYKASRPGDLVFLVDGYEDVFSDMLDSERARLLEGINRTLEDMIGRGSGFLRRVASGRYIAVVEERQMEQFANRGYDVPVSYTHLLCGCRGKGCHWPYPRQHRGCASAEGWRDR